MIYYPPHLKYVQVELDDYDSLVQIKTRVETEEWKEAFHNIDLGGHPSHVRTILDQS